MAKAEMMFTPRRAYGSELLLFTATKNCSIFKNYFSSLPHNLVFKLPISPNIFTESKIESYYDKNVVLKDLNFQLSETSPEKIF